MRGKITLSSLFLPFLILGLIFFGGFRLFWTEIEEWRLSSSVFVILIGAIILFFVYVIDSGALEIREEHLIMTETECLLD